MKPPRTQETADVFGASTNDPVLPLDVLYIFLGHLIMLYIMTYFEDDFFARNKWGDNRHPSRRRLRRAHRDLSVFLGWRTYLIRRKKGASQTAQVERARGAFSTPWICSISKTALKIDLLVASRWAAPAAAQAESEIRSTLLQEKRFFFFTIHLRLRRSVGQRSIYTEILDSKHWIKLLLFVTNGRYFSRFIPPWERRSHTFLMICRFEKGKVCKAPKAISEHRAGVMSCPSMVPKIHKYVPGPQ